VGSKDGERDREGESNGKDGSGLWMERRMGRTVSGSRMERDREGRGMRRIGAELTDRAGGF